MGRQAGNHVHRRIAVIEDDEHVSMLLCYNLRAAGYEPEACGDGYEALRRLMSAPPALVLLDWMMPGLSGIEILRALRKAPELRGLPVLMVTARTGLEDRNRALGLGVDEVLAKPFSISYVLTRVQALLSDGENASAMRN